MIFMALPFVFVTFVIQFPAGLLVYWITTNIWTIGQQAIIKKRLGPLRPPCRGGGPHSLFDELPVPGGRTGRRRARAACREGRAAIRAATSRRAARQPAARATKEEEEAFGEKAMSASGDRVKDLLEHLSDALALDATVVDRGGGPEHPGDARGRRPGAVHRPPRPDDRRCAAPRLQGRDARSPPAAGCASSSTPLATASAASRRSSARPTRPRRRRCDRPPGRAGRDERHRAQGRARVPQGSRRRRDVLRGHGARPALVVAPLDDASGVSRETLRGGAAARGRRPGARSWSSQAHDETASTTVRDPGEAVGRHVADSLSALELPYVRDAAADRRSRLRRRLAGLALAAALPEAARQPGRERDPALPLPRARHRGRRAWPNVTVVKRAPRPGPKASAPTTSSRPVHWAPWP